MFRKMESASMHQLIVHVDNIWAVSCGFQQCGILTCVVSDEPLQPPFKLRNSKWYSVSSLTIIEYSSDSQRLWSDCTYAQADRRPCWSHIPHCWKSHAQAHFISKLGAGYEMCLVWAHYKQCTTIRGMCFHDFCLYKYINIFTTLMSSLRCHDVTHRCVVEAV